MMRLCLVLSFISLPLITNAAVSFSEIAWMGDNVSANHEWIELHNSGSSVDVSGWKISDDKNLSVDLVGVIPGNSHVVLERSSDASAAGTAFMVYTGALVNTGATLKLRRLDGFIEDQIAGGDNWSQIGGDNVTKETAQYTTSGWVTAAATPGLGLSASAVVDQNIDDVAPVENVVVEKKKTSNDPVQLELPDITLELSLDLGDTGYVNQEQSMSVVADGIGDTLINSLSYSWNFGDGSVATGKEVDHMYKYPGKYVVTLHASYKRQYATVRSEVTILPVSLSLTKNRSGDVQVNNNSPYELDISGYRLVGNKNFVFPERTILLQNQTITIPKNNLGLIKENMVAVYDSEGILLASLIPDRLHNDNEEVVGGSIDLIPMPMVSSISYSPPIKLEEFSETVEVVNKSDTLDSSRIVTSGFSSSSNQSASVIESNSPVVPGRLPYALLFVTIVLALFGIYLAPKRN